MSKKYREKDSRHDRRYPSPDDENSRSIDWEIHKKTLDGLFFREDDYIQRSVSCHIFSFSTESLVDILKRS